MPHNKANSLSPQSSALSPDTQPSVLSPQSLNMPLKWLVTGGCGFIGTSLIKHLLANNLAQHIRVIDNLSVGTRDDLATVCNFTEVSSSSLSPKSSVLSSTKVELIVGDILNANLAVEVCRGIDVVVHLAANTGVPISVAEPRKDCVANVIGTFNYLEAARNNKVKRFIFASSGAPAGEVEPPIHENLPAKPVSPYGASKLAGEGYCSAYFRTYGVKTVSLRFSNVYGPGSGHKTSVVAKFIKQALAGETLEIYGDGTQTRDFIYIDDLINAILLAVNPNPQNLSPQSSVLSPDTKSSVPSPDFNPKSSVLSPQSLSPPWGEIFQIATSRETTLDEITELMLKIFVENGIEEPRVKKTEARLGDVKRNFSDTRKAREVLGWECGWRLIKGLEITVGWYLKGSATINQ